MAPKLITGSTYLCVWAPQETFAQTRNDQVWGPGALFPPNGPAVKLLVLARATFYMVQARTFSTLLILEQSTEMGRSGLLQILASSSPFCLRAPLTYHAVRPDPRSSTRMGGHGQEGCTTLPRLFLSSTCGLSLSNGSPPPSSFMVRPKSFISVGLAVLGLGVE